MTEPTKSLSEFKIRPPVAADAEILSRVHALAWEETYPDEAHGVTLAWVKTQTAQRLTPDGLESRLELIRKAAADPEHIFFRAVFNSDETHCFGFIYIARTGKTAEIEALYLTNAAKGTGIAQELMEQGMDFIGDLSCNLWVADYNERAIRFYQKYGFVIVPNSAKPHREVLTIIEMKCPAGQGGRHEI